MNSKSIIKRNLVTQENLSQTFPLKVRLNNIRSNKPKLAQYNQLIVQQYETSINFPKMNTEACMSNYKEEIIIKICSKA